VTAVGRTLETPMPQARDWKAMQELSARLLEERTGAGVEAWNRRIQAESFRDEQHLREWLTERGVTGYPRSLLVKERFGYPDYLLASADELIDGQYADRPHLRPILDALLEAVVEVGEVVIQARKTFVSLVTPRRTFARVQATTRNRVDLLLRLESTKPAGRLQASKLHESMAVHISLASRDEVDAEVLEWLQRAYDENC
jgi:hypothetical protein